MHIQDKLLRVNHFPIRSRDRLKATLINLVLLLATLVMLIDVYGSLIHGYYMMSLIEGTSTIIFMITYALFYYTITLKTTITIVLTVLSFLFIISLSIPGENPHLALFWLATLPIFIFFFLGIISGLKWTIVILFILVLTTLNAAYAWLSPLYTVDFLAQITLGYAAISYFVYTLERERSGFENRLLTSIKEKEILYQELNHRVKNNLQMILSLIKLQISRTDSAQSKEELRITQNRIDSISALYESLHLEEQIHQISTLEYLSTIIEKIKPLTSKDVEIIFDVQYNVDRDQLLYVGLILNELATNAFKYAFKEEGELHISLYKKEDYVYMIVEDNGIGFKDKIIDSLGFTIVKTLVEKQLFGTLDVISNGGTKITLCWKD